MKYVGLILLGACNIGDLANQPTGTSNNTTQPEVTLQPGQTETTTTVITETPQYAAPLEMCVPSDMTKYPELVNVPSSTNGEWAGPSLAHTYTCNFSNATRNIGTADLSLINLDGIANGYFNGNEEYEITCVFSDLGSTVPHYAMFFMAAYFGSSAYNPAYHPKSMDDRGIGNGFATFEEAPSIGEVTMVFANENDVPTKMCDQ